MTTSLSTNFNATRDQIIRRALRQIGAISAGETPDAQTVSDCAFALNSMVKEWDAMGIHVWTETEATLFLQPSQIQYTLGPDSTDHCAQTWDQTTLTANAASGATSVTVDSISGIVANYQIGIVLNDDSIFWTTVNGSPSGSTVTLASGLLAAALDGAGVYFYQSNIMRPLRVPHSRRYHILSAIETPMIRMSRFDYRDLPNKNDTGTVTQFFYDPQTQGSNSNWTADNGYYWVWPAPDSSEDAIKFTWYRSIQDFDAAGNTPDFPAEWLNCLSWNLAMQMAPEYDVPSARFQILAQQAALSLDRVNGWDREPESVYFGVDFDQMAQRMI